MRRVKVPLEDDVNIECPYQTIGPGSLICRCADVTIAHSTNEVSDNLCHECDAGKIFREIGCDAFTAKLIIISHHDGSGILNQTIFCKRRKRETTLAYCSECSLVGSPTTRETVATARGLFQNNDFFTAYKQIEDARRSLRDGDFDGTITSSVSSLESVLKNILDRQGVSYPRDETVTSLWKKVRETLTLDAFCSSDSEKFLLSSLTGSVSHLGGIRNQLGDAHGKGEVAPEVPYLIAELSLNTSATLATYIIRRYEQIGRST